MKYLTCSLTLLSGAGKTCVVKTATSKRYGVVSLLIPPDPALSFTSQDEIKAKVFKEVTGLQFFDKHFDSSAIRVLWWHHFLFRVPVTVVLRGDEIKRSGIYAAVDSAALTLSRDYGVRVIIDASTNCIPLCAISSKHDIELELEPMARALIEHTPDQAFLRHVLKEHDLADIVWACIGSNLADYNKLATACAACNSVGYKGVDKVVAHFLQALLGKAIYNVNAAMVENAKLKHLFELFIDRPSGMVELSVSVLTELQIELNFKRDLTMLENSKVLKLVQLRKTSGESHNGEYFLVPVDNATAMVLQFALNKTGTPSITEIHLMMAHMRDFALKTNTPVRVPVVGVSAAL